MRIKVKNPTRFTLFILSILAVIFLISACRNHFLTMGDLRDSLSRNHGRENLEKKYMVVIDPGHGGKDSGAIGASGRFEKDFTLSLSKKVAERLEQEPEIGVYLTREDDSFISTKGCLLYTSSTKTWSFSSTLNSRWILSTMNSLLLSIRLSRIPSTSK